MKKVTAFTTSAPYIVKVGKVGKQFKNTSLNVE